jgi:hypothetical protein
MSKYSLRFQIDTKNLKSLIKDNFAKEVKAKKYNKIHYDIYQKLVSLSDTNYVIIEINYNSQFYDFYDLDSLCAIVYQNQKLCFNHFEIWAFETCDTYEQNKEPLLIEMFKVDDNSFGSYLFDLGLNYIRQNYNYHTLYCGKLSNIYVTFSKLGKSAESMTNSITELASHLSDISYIDTNVMAPLSTNKITSAFNDFIKEEIHKELAEEKEKDDMNNFGIEFDFGPCTDDQCRISMYGIALKNVAGNYVSYNKETGEIVNVEILNFKGAKYIYKIPVGLSEIKLGDVIIHARRPMIVLGLPSEGSKAYRCVDVIAGEEKLILPTKSPFGFDFISKLISIMDMGNMSAGNTSPFGNMLPFMLMNNSEDVDPLMMMMCMGNNNTDLFQNPFMMYALMGNKNNDSLLPLMFMSQNFNK